MQEQGADIERRIARFARQSARLMREIRDGGDIEGAMRFEALAIEIVDDMRRRARQGARP